MEVNSQHGGSQADSFKLLVMYQERRDGYQSRGLFAGLVMRREIYLYRLPFVYRHCCLLRIQVMAKITHT